MRGKRNRQRRAADGAHAERQRGHALQHEEQRVHVAREHGPVAAQQVRERNRLRALPVGIGGEDGVALGLGAVGEARHEGGERIEGQRHLLADVEVQVQRHLVVARARRVQQARGLAERLGEQGLDGHVHVLLVRQREGAGLGGLEDAHELGLDRLRLLAGDDAAARQHGEVREAAHEVLAQEGLVERQRAGEGEHLGQQPGATGGGRLGDHPAT
jgi:hypothetical protein